MVLGSNPPEGGMAGKTRVEAEVGRGEEEHARLIFENDYLKILKYERANDYGLITNQLHFL